VTTGSGNPVVVWHFTDGKAGHENQAQGLLAALSARRTVQAYRMHTGECARGLLECIRGHDPFGDEIPDPDLIIGAGHATHMPMLNARRIRGGRVVVLMKPTLPLGWFDLCVIPAHDRPRHAENVFVTHGVLNRIRPTTGHDPGRGLILLGGPSPHVRWSDESVCVQIREIVTRQPEISWQLASSRRTPETLLKSVTDAQFANVTPVPVSATTPDWLPLQLQQAGQAWVTADSVSMIYEALTSGAAVGVIDVPYLKPTDRIAVDINSLVLDDQLVRLADWVDGKILQPPARVFDEATRCADWIIEQWLSAG
jgi:mitochondrial fission protein ELM1